MKSRNLLIAAVLLLGLSGLVWWAKQHPSSTTPDSSTPPSPKLADIPASDIQQIDLTRKDGTTTTVKRQDGKWVITAPQPLPADQDAVSSLLSSLSPMTADSVVEEKTTNPGQFGLTAPNLTVKVYEKNGKTEQFVFGSDSSVGSLTYAEVGSGPKVYAVATNTKTSLDKTSNDLRDKRLLAFDTNKLTSVDLTSPKGKVQFAKNNGGDWQIVKPQPYRADSFQVEELVRKLGDAKMDTSTSADDAKKADAAFKTGTPVGSASVTDASGTKTLDVRKNKDDYYARSNALPGAYKVTADLGTEIDKPVDDFRNRKLFDFGFTDASRIEVQQNGATTTYTLSGTDWKSNGKTMEAGSMQAFIDKLRDLAATKFSTTAFPAETLMITVVSNNGKRTDKVEFAKGASNYLAQRQGEPTVYELDTNTVSDMLKASAAIKPAAKK